MRCQISGIQGHIKEQRFTAQGMQLSRIFPVQSTEYPYVNLFFAQVATPGQRSAHAKNLAASDLQTRALVPIVLGSTE